MPSGRRVVKGPDASSERLVGGEQGLHCDSVESLLCAAVRGGGCVLHSRPPGEPGGGWGGGVVIPPTARKIRSRSPLKAAARLMCKSCFKEGYREGVAAILSAF